MSMRYKRFNAGSYQYGGGWWEGIDARPYRITSRHNLCLLDLPYGITFDDFERYDTHNTSEYLNTLWEIISGNWWTASGSLYTNSSNARIRFRTNYPQISGDWDNYNFFACQVDIVNQLPDDLYDEDNYPKDDFGGGLIDINSGEYVAKAYDYYSYIRLEHNDEIKTRYGHYWWPDNDNANSSFVLYINPNDAIYIGDNTLVYEIEDEVQPISSVCLGTSDLYPGQVVKFDNFKYLVPKADARLLGTSMDINEVGYGISTYKIANKQLADDIVFAKYCNDCINIVSSCSSCYQGRFPRYFQLTLSGYTGLTDYHSSDGSINYFDLSQLNGTYILGPNINSVKAYGLPNPILHNVSNHEACAFSYIGDVVGEDGESLKLLLRIQSADCSTPYSHRGYLSLQVAIIVPNEYIKTESSFVITPESHPELFYFDKSCFYIAQEDMDYYSYYFASDNITIGVVSPQCTPNNYLEWYYDDYWNHWEIPSHSQTERPIEYADFSTHKLWVQTTGVWIHGAYFDKNGIRDEVYIPDEPGKYAVYYDSTGSLQCSDYPIDSTNMVFDYVRVKHFFGVPTNKNYDGAHDVWVAQWATDAYRYLATPKLNMIYVPTFPIFPNYSVAHSRLGLSHGFDNKDDSSLSYTDNTVTIEPTDDDFRIATVQYPIGGTWLEDMYPYLYRPKTDIFYTKYDKPKTLSVPNSGTWYLCYVLKQSQSNSYDWSTSGKTYIDRYNIRRSETFTYSQIESPYYSSQTWFELCWVTGLQQRCQGEYIDRGDEYIVLTNNTEVFVPSSDYALYTVYAHKVPIAKVDCIDGNIMDFEDLRQNITGSGLVYSPNVEFPNVESYRSVVPNANPYGLTSQVEYQDDDAAKWSSYYNLFGTLKYMPFYIEFNDSSGIISIIPKEKFYIHIGEDIITKTETESIAIDRTKLQRRFNPYSQPYIPNSPIFDIGSYENYETQDYMLMFGQGYICGYDAAGNLAIEETDEVYKQSPYSNNGYANATDFYNHTGTIVIPLFLTTYNKMVYHRFDGKQLLLHVFDGNSPYEDNYGIPGHYLNSALLKGVPAKKIIGTAGLLCKQFDHVAMSNNNTDGRQAVLTSIV